MLRPAGIVNDDEEIIERMDASPGPAKEVLPLSRKKDGSYAENSLLMSRENIDLVSSYAAEKIKELGGGILDGEIGMHPYGRKDREACTYCPYSKVCGFDEKLPGYEKRVLPEEDREEILERMRARQTEKTNEGNVE